MEFIIDGTIYYLDKVIDMFSDGLDVDEVILSLKPIFENDKALKITASAKQDMHLLCKYGIKLNNYFDLTVGDYIINAGLKQASNFSLEDYLDKYNSLKKQISENKLDIIYEDIEKPLIEILFNMEEMALE